MFAMMADYKRVVDFVRGSFAPVDFGKPSVFDFIMDLEVEHGLEFIFPKNKFA